MVHGTPKMNLDEIQKSVKERFARIAENPAQEKKFPVGPESAKKLGYDHDLIDQLSPAMTESFCGVGNPLSLGKIREGMTVLDLGCGSGMDSILAAQFVGPTGRVIGVDQSQEMIAKARGNAAPFNNIEFIQGDIDNIPRPENSVDVVISNGVFNLCVDKPKVLAEIFRVLRPGGRLQMADILLEEGISEEELARKGSWSD